jgi:hypothetical protein
LHLIVRTLRRGEPWSRARPGAQDKGIAMTIPSKAAIAALAFGLLGPLAAAAQGIYAYPAKGQSHTQQSKDQKYCHGWAVRQSGFDPGYTPPPPPQKGGVLRGAAGGALVGSIGGAIGGNAGRGAAIGAATGGLIGGIRQNQQNRAIAQQHEAKLASFNSALTACLRGRGYTVN